MNESPFLFNTLLMAVAQMRTAQREYQLYGESWRADLVAKFEREVDDLVELHLMPSLLNPGEVR